MNTHLSQEEFENIYDKVPRLCVDLVIKNELGILLALRSVEPYKDMWNLPGGTVYKGENISETAIRIAKLETGLDVNPGKFIGYLEYFNEKRGEALVHTVSIVLDATVNGGELQHDENTSELKYFNELPENLVEEQKDFLLKLK